MVQGTSQVQPPKVVLPSPEAYSFTKYGDIPIGLFTGTMNYSVPIVNIKSGKLSLPISLDYTTNGVKVDEVSGRTGMGWNLRTGGVITRTILGKADEIIPLADTVPSLNDSTGLYQYMQHVTNGPNNNTQPDEFSYSFLGHSGKFYINKNGEVQQLSPNGFRITFTDELVEFKIVATDGTSYFFGNQARDFSGSYSYFGNNDVFESYGREGYTAWYLTKIKNVYGDSIVFNYSAISTIQNPIEYFSSISQTHVLGDAFNNLVYQVSSNCPYPGSMTPAYAPWGHVQCQEGVGIFTDYTMSRIGVVKLDEIVFKQGKLLFYYGEREDLPGEKRVDSIGLFNKANERIRSAQFKYSYSQSSSMYNLPEIYSPAAYSGYTFQDYFSYLKKRLFLSEVILAGVDNVNTQKYGFEYDAINDLPARLSFAQDKFGYFNGRLTNTVESENVYLSILMGLPTGIVRGVNPAYSGKGTLKKIKYPTGGFTAIQYEPHSLIAGEKKYDTIKLNLTEPSVSPTVYSNYFEGYIPVKLEIKAIWITTPDPSAPQYDSTIVVTIEDSVTGAVIGDSIITNPSLPYDGFNSALYAMVSKSINKGPYRIKIHSNHPDIRAEVKYIRLFETGVLYNKPSAGVRVSLMEHFTSPGKSSLLKKYEYNSPGTSLSSGGLINDFQDARDFAYYKRAFCTGPAGDMLTHNLVFSLESGLGQFVNDYASINYEYVTEYQDSLGINGSIVNRFYIEPNQLPQTLVCAYSYMKISHTPFLIQGTPYSNTGFRNGKQKEQLVYRINGGEKYLEKHSKYYYSVDNRNFQADSFFAIRRAFTRSSYDTGVVHFGDYDINIYMRYAAWVHLDSTVEREYDNIGNSLVHVTAYSYDNPAHLQVTKTAIKNSNNKLLVSEVKFPGDMGSGLPYSQMVDRNMITQPVLSRQLTDTMQTSMQETVFADWFNNNTVIVPSLIKSQKASTDPLEIRLQYLNYDSSGNPLTLIDPAGLKLSYIWGRETENPIAEVLNAGTEQIAYSGFENDGLGQWQYPASGETNLSGAIMGRGSYTLGAGAIEKSQLSNNTSYVVSFWMKNLSGTALINGVEATTMIERNGWMLKRIMISGSSSVTISGTGVIDELRLYPEGAQMKTYSFQSLVGMTGQSDVNNNIQYYEYDNMGRLRYIRNQNKQIIKSYEYQFQ